MIDAFGFLVTLIIGLFFGGIAGAGIMIIVGIIALVIALYIRIGVGPSVE